MSDFVKASQVFVDNPSKSREEVLQLLSEQAVALGMAEDAATVRAAYDAREDMGATGMQDGFAIPHAKSAAVTRPCVLVVRSDRPLEGWETMDRAPVTCAVAIMVPDTDAGTPYLRLLAKLAVMLMNDGFAREVLSPEDPAEVAAAIDAGLEA